MDFLTYIRVMCVYEYAQENMGHVYVLHKMKASTLC